MIQPEESTTATLIGTEPAPPLCQHLRSKRMYVTNSFEVEAGSDEDREHCYGHCWCLKTMYDFGPDDQRVHRKACQPGRACYEAS